MNSEQQIHYIVAKKKMKQVLSCLRCLDSDLFDSWNGLKEGHQREIESYEFEEDGNDLYNDEDGNFLHNEDGEDDDDDDDNDIGVFTLANSDLDKTKLWNIFEYRDRQEILDKIAQDNDEITGYSLLCINYKMNTTTLRLVNHCSDIEIYFQQFCKGNASLEDRMNILRFYSLFNSFMPTSSIRQSIDAFSIESECKTDIIAEGATLSADKIHYNMFKSNESEFGLQKFKRFEIGGQRDGEMNLLDVLDLGESEESVRSILPGAVKGLEHVQCFLYHLINPDEAHTQHVFRAFLDDFIGNLSASVDSANNNASASVVILTGMDPVEIDVQICSSYMDSVYQKKGRVRLSQGPVNANLRIQSDLAIFCDSNANHDYSAGAATQQKNMFLNCQVNVEMKRWWSVAKEKTNHSPLTQVAAESLARAKALRDDDNRVCPNTLYSLLTDGAVIYCLCHKVEHNEYWISRKLSDPGEIVLSICWMYLCSIGKVNVPDLSKWEVSNEAKDRDDGEVDDVDRTDDSKSSDKSHNNDGYQESVTPEATKQEHDIMLPVISFEDDEVAPLHPIDRKTVNMNENDQDEISHNQYIGTHQHTTSCEATKQEHDVLLPVITFEDDDEDKEEEHKMWQTLFLLENHRKYGTPLPLTEEFISLHETRDCI